MQSCGELLTSTCGGEALEAGDRSVPAGGEQLSCSTDNIHLQGAASVRSKWPLSTFHSGDAGNVLLSKGTEQRIGPKHVTAVKQDGSLNLANMEQMKVMVKIQSLLQRLKNQEVRGHFVAGRILKSDDPETVLVSLDVMGELLFPAWSSSTTTREIESKAAVEHFQLLVNRSLSVFKLPHKTKTLDEHPYATWMRAITKIMTSKYWFSIPAPADHEVKPKLVYRKPLYISSDDSDEDARAREQSPHHRHKSVTYKRKKMSRRVAFEGESSSSGLQSEAYSPRKYFQSRRPKTGHGLRTIEITDSSDDDTEEHSSDTSFSSLRKQKRYFPKDTVMPEKFDINGKQSLKKFFEAFERYFRSKYDGTQRECSQELARFIDGEVKEAYDALGGSQRKYRDLKPALLQWYKAQSVGRSHKYKAEFKQLTMREGETFKLYCMRLQGVAHRAYPNEEKECAKQLKKKIVKTTPSWFSRCLEKKEEMKVMLKVGKSITWGEIIEIAEQQDKRLKKKELTNDSDDDLHTRFDKLRCHVSETASAGAVAASGGPGTKMFRNSQMPRGRPSSPTTCEHCERRGHNMDDCWRKKGACTICGSLEHPIKECPKYSPDFRRSRRQSCFNCQGPHLARDCPERPLNA